MARDRGYGSGFNNTGMPRYTTTSVSQGQTGFHIRDSANEWSLNFGGLQLLGIQKGSVPSQQARTVAQTGGTKPIGQLAKMVTGVGYDSKGKFGVDPLGLAMAWTPAKIGKIAQMGHKIRGADDLAEVSSSLIGTGAKFGGDVTRRLDQGAQSVRRSAEGAYEALLDRSAAAEYGKDIARLMAQNKLRSVPNNLASAVRGRREVYSPVSEAVPASLNAQRIAPYRNPGSVYPSGVPAGGWVQSPNLRQFTPGVSEYARVGGAIDDTVRVVEGGLTEAQRAAAGRIRELLNEATIRRNLSAGMKPGGEYYFPRPYQPYNFSRTSVGGRLDPAEYQAQVMDFIRGKVEGRRQIK